ncbi:MAG: DUF4340 domain-containing protein [Acetobacteraceae bacterium]|nr:DUF4340 domain-containing protein [Acetobacteraceae bacterium]
MSPRRAIILFAAGLAVFVCGWYFGTASQPVERQSFAAGRLLFPDLAPKLAQVARIEIVHQNKAAVTIEKSQSGWALAERGGYPVVAGKLHALLTGLTELRLLEPRTSDPANFGRLGVDPAEDGNLLRVLDANNKPIVELVVGHSRSRPQGNLPEQVYVRRPNENQSWLAEGHLDLEADPQLWLDREIMSIDHGRVASVAVHRGEDSLQFARQGDKFMLLQPADHPALEDFKVEDVGRALEALSFEDVRPTKDTPAQSDAQSVFATTDGLTITANLTQDGKEAWVHFTASGSDKTKAEADRLNAKLASWAYHLESWKEKAVVPALDDLKKAPPPKAEARPGAAPAALGKP